MTPDELFDDLQILDREEFTDELMYAVTGIQEFTKETQAGASLIPQLDLVSLGEYLMLHEMIHWAAVKLLTTLNELTTSIQSEIEARENAS